MAIQPEATPRQAYEAVRDGRAVLIDVREPWEHRQIHIGTAVLIPLAELPDRLHEIPADRDVYVHCRLGSRSQRAVEYLIGAGRPRAHDVLGGIDAWEEAGLPVERFSAARRAMA